MLPDPSLQLSSDPPSRPRFPPSLLTMPPEIKGQIIGELVEDGIMTCLYPNALRSLCAMSRVSREFAALTEPFVWRGVNLHRFDTRKLIYFVLKILPRHSHQVRFLTINQSRRGMPARPEYIDVANSLAQEMLGEATAEHNEAAIIAQKSRILALAISSLPRLTIVTCHDLRLPEPKRQRKDYRSSREDKYLVSRALVSLGDRLRKIDVDFCNWCSEDALAAFLSQFHSLSSIALRTAWVRTSGRNTFVSSLSSLLHLTSININSSDLITDAFAAAPWICPLETLSLYSCRDISLPSLLTFLSNFSTTLTSLDLFYPEEEETTTDPLIRLNPPLLHLRNLSLITSYNSAFLTCFDRSPISHLTIGENARIHTSAWEAFIQSHAATLQRVTIPAASVSSPCGPVPRLRGVCERNGIVWENHREVDVDVEC